ncbi:hypothetical protein BDA96_02G094400 [Sorghum bicolor]|uniref:Pectinesterase inhibitor domain-containing protein n=2 Tax=Sorghum bicolor TaxID=4558 RepID=A0A921RL55_SORBI|nr:nischarin [Sorghum bicolor]KAG0542333.1 hypothetical protein BDA96_02G094400 [Sorghum bicolor]KXG34782.1 hypothetical protein SORBI_3002G091300 [Sorghum bicolor]|eukprot:XP_021308721.1 nischarin [Sorghum bicolor]
MARSVSVVVVLLLSVLVSAASAARTVGDTVQDACSKTQFPKICVDSLAAKPESQKATPRKLAELFVNIAAEKGSGMATFVHGKYNNDAKDSALFKCYDSCSDDVEEAVAHLNGLVREPTDAKFLELKSWLSSTLGGTSTCEDACKDAPKSGDKDAVVNFSLDFEKLQRVTLDLITEASGSMSAGIALPPSDAGAPSSYDAAAPSSSGGGSADAPAGADAGAGAGSEGPAAASGPSSGGDAPADGGSAASGPAAADAPAAAGAASSSDGPSGAPAPSSSDSASGAPGPSSDGGSSSAPAPAGGDDDDDADSDDGSA